MFHWFPSQLIIFIAQVIIIILKAISLPNWHWDITVVIYVFLLCVMDAMDYVGDKYVLTWFVQFY